MLSYRSAGFLATSLASYFVSKASVREGIVESGLPLTADNIYSEIQKDLLRPIFISSMMSHDETAFALYSHFLTCWFPESPLVRPGRIRPRRATAHPAT